MEGRWASSCLWGVFELRKLPFFELAPLSMLGFSLGDLLLEWALWYLMWFWLLSFRTNNNRLYLFCTYFSSEWGIVNRMSIVAGAGDQTLTFLFSLLRTENSRRVGRQDGIKCEVSTGRDFSEERNLYNSEALELSGADGAFAGGGFQLKILARLFSETWSSIWESHIGRSCCEMLISTL
ncbi:hypothetical protein F2Q70_00023361 [Brassica cretica]|uniref:Uncharacterized protein n=1 Tax=Brassica cretica TaxID=69181 RepID=A0A8S9GRK9_BRACR|nr:hypothetical protein F2Q70_00023361 [Brassica cretica]KAF2557999.1 hypothetical protein F2Q68_00017649 [Brassica cretica]